MTDDAQTDDERAVAALYDFLMDFFLGHRIAWMHGVLGRDEAAKGRASALTGLVLIPDLRKAFDAIDAHRNETQFPLGPTLERWHPEFESKD